MGKAIRASVLTLLLACSASAGVMTYGVYEPPPPPPPQQSSVEVQGPVEPTQDAEADKTMTAFVVQVALDLLALL